MLAKYLDEVYRVVINLSFFIEIGEQYALV